MSEPKMELLDQPCKPSILETLLMCKEQKTSQKGQFSKPLTTTLPKSQVLGKIKNFLGEIAMANEKLELEVKEKPKEEFDLEALTGNETELIQMDLLLGVADLNSDNAIAAAEANMNGFQPATKSDISDSSSSEESDEEEKCEVKSQRKQEQQKDELAQENNPKKRQKKIVVIN